MAGSVVVYAEQFGVETDPETREVTVSGQMPAGDDAPVVLGPET